jgi:hypothetical protein
VAARLQSLAAPGTILISDVTHRAVRDYVECQSQGSRPMKGKTEPVPVYRVLRAHTIPTQGRRDQARQIGAPLIGRTAETSKLTDSVRAAAAGRGGVVCVLGEAGLGKSRLVAEVRRNATDGVRWLEGRALSFGRTLSYFSLRIGPSAARVSAGRPVVAGSKCIVIR